jgi:hypothetical protein
VNVSRPAGSLSKPRNRRVAAVDSIDVTVGILVTVIGGVILATILGVSKLTRDRLKAKGEEATETIRIEPPAGLQASAAVRYALLHVRDGTDEVAGNEEPKNEVINFARADTTALEATLVYRRKLGCQFKCFVDVREGTLSPVDIELLAADRPWALDKPKPVLRNGYPWSRYHFLLREKYRVVATRDGFLNNYVDFTAT